MGVWQQPVRTFTHEYGRIGLPGSGLQVRGQVYRRTNQGIAAAVAGAEFADHNLTRVDADTQLQRQVMFKANLFHFKA